MRQNTAVAASPLRLTFVQTHPIQYVSPWFRFIAAQCPDIVLTVVYATIPSPSQQGVGYGVSFEWDSDNLSGYTHVQARPSLPGDNVHSGNFFGIDAPTIADAVRQTAPDAVVIAGWYSIALVRALLGARLSRIPAIYRGDNHEIPLRTSIDGVIRAARTRMMLSAFKTYLTVGSRNRGYLRSFGIADERIFFAPHSVDNDFFGRIAAETRAPSRWAAKRRDLGIGGKAFVVLFVGKIESLKRPLDIVAAAGKLDQACVLFVGSGPEQSRCRDEAQRLGVKAIFAGFVNQSRLGEMYAIADVCVLASESETWGLVVNEALASGTPCIVSDRVGSGPELIQPGATGFSYPVGNVEALAQALTEVRKRRELGDSFADTCRSVVSRFSFEVATTGLRLAAYHAAGRLRAVGDHGPSRATIQGGTSLDAPDTTY